MPCERAEIRCKIDAFWTKVYRSLELTTEDHQFLFDFDLTRDSARNRVQALLDPEEFNTHLREIYLDLMTTYWIQFHDTDSS